MYKVIEPFHGVDEGRTFEVGEVVDFPDKRGGYLTEKGFVIPCKKEKKKDEQPSADVS